MRVVLVPGVLALLPAYASIEDPVAELRAACLAAVRWLGPSPEVLADAQGAQVASYLIAEASGGGSSTSPASTKVEEPPPPGVLVVGNGSACRTEKAPGYLDERAEAFDDAVRAALTSSRPMDLPPIELEKGLLACLDGIRQLPLGELGEATVDYDDAPFGVQYWVMRWQR